MEFIKAELAGDVNKVAHEAVLICYNQDGTYRAVAFKEAEKIKDWIIKNAENYRVIVVYLAATGITMTSVEDLQNMDKTVDSYLDFVDGIRNPK